MKPKIALGTKGRTMNELKTLIGVKRLVAVFGVCLSFLSTSSWATTINLAFDTLPSAQGWQYQGSVPEASVWSVDGTTLTMNSLLGTNGMDANTSVYFMNNIIDPNLPFTISVRARVLQGDTATSLPFAFVGFTGSEIFQAVLGQNNTRIQAQDFLSDNTQFHDFRFEASPSIGSSFFVDNNLLASFAPFPSPVSNGTLFGDGSAFPNSNGIVEIQQYTFTQGMGPGPAPIPEPATFLLFGSGLVGLMGWRLTKIKKA